MRERRDVPFVVREDLLKLTQKLGIIAITQVDTEDPPNLMQLEVQDSFLHPSHIS